MRIVVTGAGGFIGQALSAWARVQGWEVLPRSLRDGVQRLEEDRLPEELAAWRPDFVVHCAACHHPRRGPEAWEAQRAGTLWPALRVAHAVPPSVRLAVFLGSCEEYGNSTPPFREEGPLKVFSPYGWAKIAAFQAVRFIAQERGLACCWTRPFLTFGPGQGGDLLVPSLVEACRHDRRLALTPGEQTRDFIYIDDVIAMLACLLREPAKAVGEVFNLCSGVPRRVRDVGLLIRDMVGRGTLDFGALPYRPQEAMAFFGSRDKFERTFGPLPQVPFDVALRRTLHAAGALPPDS